jgi:hypothetical protein
MTVHDIQEVSKTVIEKRDRWDVRIRLWTVDQDLLRGVFLKMPIRR